MYRIKCYRFENEVPSSTKYGSDSVCFHKYWACFATSGVVKSPSEMASNCGIQFIIISPTVINFNGRITVSQKNRHLGSLV